MGWINVANPKKQWQGISPRWCDICHRPIGKSFVDGKILHSQLGGNWAIMCLRCHAQVGVGLGLGKGQQYTLQHEGGPDEESN